MNCFQILLSYSTCAATSRPGLPLSHRFTCPNSYPHSTYINPSVVERMTATEVYRVPHVFVRIGTFSLVEPLQFDAKPDSQSKLEQ